MSEAQAKKKDVVRVDFAFRRELAEKVEGNLSSFCYQCGACVGDCPSAAYVDDFNPRKIMLMVLYGLGDELISDTSILWSCTNCYNCAERCPQDVKPAEVIISMKNMLADRGIYPEGAEKIIATVMSCGRTVPESSAVDKQRAKFGLPPLSRVPVEDLEKLVQPAGAGGEE